MVRCASGVGAAGVEAAATVRLACQQETSACVSHALSLHSKAI